MNGIDHLFKAIGMPALPQPKVRMFQDQEIVKGTVLKIFPNATALLFIGGMKLVAAVEAEIRPLETYWFQTSLTDKGIMLKRLFTDSGEGQNGKRLLSHFQLSSENMAIRLVDTLIQKNIPFSKHQLADAIPLMKQFRGLAGEDKLLQAFFIAFAQRLPMTKEVITSLLALQDDKQLFQELFDLYDAVKHGENRPDLKQLKNMLFQLTNPRFMVQIENVINTLQKSEDSFSQSLAEKLAFWLKENPAVIRQFFFENESADTPFTKEEQKTVQTLMANSYKNLDAAELKQLLKMFLANLGLAASQQNLEQDQHNLKAMLHKHMLEADKPDVKAMFEHLYNRLNGQSYMQDQRGPIDQLFIQIPFQFGEDWTDVTFQINAKKENERLDANFCRIVFSLYLKTIKETVVDVFIQNRVLKITIYNDLLNEHEIEAHSNELQEKLQQLNYILSGVSLKKGKTNEKAQSLMVQKTYQRVDMKI